MIYLILIASAIIILAVFSLCRISAMADAAAERMFIEAKKDVVKCDGGEPGA